MTRGNGESQVQSIEELVQRIQGGEAAAFEGIYQRFFDPIYRYILFRISDQTSAEDLTQEVFLKALQSINSFRWRGFPFSSWLFRIAHNLVVDSFRHKSRERWVQLDLTEETPSPDVDQHLELKLTMEQVKRLMKNLTEAQREVISLRFAAGLSVGEVARAVGKRENAVKALQHAGIVKLRNAIQSKGEKLYFKGKASGIRDETVL
ncbi:MAG: sigma-70 family RNA polymerase sigma factor [Chloroflexi bacterium]|nr:sigma-70 family RNA polymerase sigma factor [Chloroflexota bacterium]